MPADPARLAELFDALGAADAAERSSTLEHLDAADPDTARELRRLLVAIDADPDFLETPPRVDGDTLLRALEARTTIVDAATDDPDPPPPDAIPGYEIVREIGRGGGGRVYEAVQQRPRRTVAIKLLRGRTPSAAARERFEREAEILAALEHPGVAPVYHVGEVTQGETAVPFIVMPLIDDAAPITRAVAREAMSIDAALGLFAEVCDAVHHAHQRAVIHRDLKPANILVDAEGRVRVIDFGVARLTTDADPPSGAGGLVGTIGYMSPEQLAPGAAAIDTRSDVFALGVVLEEVIAAASDAPSAGLRADELRRIVAVARAITPADRYHSAAALRDDIRRWRRGEAVTVMPATTGYTLATFVRRRRPLVIGAAGFVALLALATIVSVALLLRIAEAERAEAAQQTIIDTAEAELADLRAALQAATSVGAVASGIVATAAADIDAASTDAERQTLIAEAVETLDRLAPVANANAAVRQTLAAAYVDLGDLQGAEWWADAEEVEASADAYARAEELWTDVLAEAPADADAASQLVDTIVRRAETARKRGDTAAATILADRALAAARVRFEAEDSGLDDGLRMIRTLWARCDARLATEDAAGPLPFAAEADDRADRLLIAFGPRPDLLDAQAWSTFRHGYWRQRAGELEPGVTLLRDAAEQATNAWAGAPDDPALRWLALVIGRNSTDYLTELQGPRAGLAFAADLVDQYLAIAPVDDADARRAAARAGLDLAEGYLSTALATSRAPEAGGDAAGAGDRAAMARAAAALAKTIAAMAADDAARAQQRGDADTEVAAADLSEQAMALVARAEAVLTDS